MAGTPPPRRQTRFILGLVLILAALPLGYFLFLYQPPPPPVPPPPVAPAVVEKAPEQPQQLQLSEVRGTVQVRRGKGDWETVTKSTDLHPSDAVRTTDGSYAVIIGGESVRVEMEPGTEVSVQELTAELTRIMLESGMAKAIVRPGKEHTFEVTAAGSDAVARTTEGTFDMSNDAAGTVAVGTIAGEVKFLGSGKVVIVRAGQQSVIRPGSNGPSEPTKIPSSLLRKVQWPDAVQKKREIVVQGEVEPGTRLELDGKSFSPNPDGTFVHTVALKEGEQEVKLKASSVGGTQEGSSQTFKLDTKPPRTTFKLPWSKSGGQAPPVQGQE